MLLIPRRALFVHIQRTGGISLRQALRDRFPTARQFISPHAHARDALDRLGPHAFYRLYRFAIVRNPWDRLVSWYSMLRDKDGPRRGKRLGWDQYRFAAARLPFPRFLEHTAHIPFKGAIFSFAFNQLDYLTDADGRWLVEDVLRFEDYDASVRRISERLGVNLLPPHKNRSQHSDYRNYYTAETRDVVARRFARDIAAFGYEF